MPHATVIATNGQTLTVNASVSHWTTEALALVASASDDVESTTTTTIQSDYTMWFPNTATTATITVKQLDGTTLFAKTLEVGPGVGTRRIAPIPDDFQVASDLSLSGIRSGVRPPAANGYLAWTYDPALSNGSTALAVAGTIYVSRLTLERDASVTNIVTHVVSAGSTLTSGQCFLALFSASGGAAIGVTADQASNWGGTGIKTAALASGPFTCTAGDYYVAAFFNGTTGPQLGRIGGALSGTLTNAGLATPNMRAASADTGRTTTFPSALGSQTAYSNHFWFALS